MARQDSSTDASIYDFINSTLSTDDPASDNSTEAQLINDEDSLITNSTNSNVTYANIFESSLTYVLSNGDDGNFFLDYASNAPDASDYSFDDDIVSQDAASNLMFFYPDEMCVQCC